MLCSTIQKRQIFETPLSVQRYRWVETYLKLHPDITTVTDFGCGNGRSLNWLKTAPQICVINCVDKDDIMLDRFLFDNFQPSIQECLFGRAHSTNPLKIRVFHGEVAVPDDRLSADCFTLIEVIEHMLPEDVEKSARAIFGYYQPKTVIITTPNSEFNVLLDRDQDSLARFRDPDHKFEWNRAEFYNWAMTVCQTFPYSVQFDGVGHLPGSEAYGPCTQIAVFQRTTNQASPNDELAIDLLLEKLSCFQSCESIVDQNVKKVSCLGEYNLKGCDASMSTYECTDWL